MEENWDFSPDKGYKEEAQDGDDYPNKNIVGFGAEVEEYMDDIPGIIEEVDEDLKCSYSKNGSFGNLSDNLYVLCVNDSNENKALNVSSKEVKKGFGSGNDYEKKAFSRTSQRKEKLSFLEENSKVRRGFGRKSGSERNQNDNEGFRGPSYPNGDGSRRFGRNNNNENDNLFALNNSQNNSRGRGFRGKQKIFENRNSSYNEFSREGEFKNENGFGDWKGNRGFGRQKEKGENFSFNERGFGRGVNREKKDQFINDQRFGNFENQNGGAKGDVQILARSYIPPEITDSDLSESQIHRGINFHNYNHIPVQCSGLNAPKDPISSFDQCQIHETVKKNLYLANYETPTPIQKWALPIVLGGRDLMGCAQTGSGKTAGFLLPIITKIIEENSNPASLLTEFQEPQAVVVGPTRELVSQIFRDALKFSKETFVKSVVLYGGVSISHQMRQLSRGVHLLIATPGRLLDFVNRKAISLKKVKFFVLDEADKMLDMGFKGDMIKLSFKLGMPIDSRQTLMFSATFPEEIQTLASQFLKDYIFLSIGRVGGANTDITQEVLLVETRDKKDKLFEILKSNAKEKVLVFVEKKLTTDYLAMVLSQMGLSSTSIHGDREQREREEALRTFKLNITPVLVATSVAARGLDIPGVDHVINFDLPSFIDDYVHRIGRTGRLGNPGKATSFFDSQLDSSLAPDLCNCLKEAQQKVPDWLESLVGDRRGTVDSEFNFKDLRGFKNKQTAFEKFKSTDLLSTPNPFLGKGFGVKQKQEKKEEEEEEEEEVWD